ncbi:hypothetical protein [Mycobacteroides abscessus]|uniref:hypothetical protein n=1 Tax=Mycobacteroides abscessus TaxID=36809 RepID=UPI000929DD27|nr:hypothetical protein [Mycobacteroides abscessus]SHY74926.1 Uncharacterised protein [Mycobacteroides abscessus subsp. abscessus]
MTNLSTAPQQSIYPYDPGYVEPDPPEDVRLVPGNVRSRVPEFEGTSYEQVGALFAHVQKEFNKHIEKTLADSHLYTREGLSRQLDLFEQTDAAKAVEGAIEKMKAVEAQAQQDLDRVRGKLSPRGDAAAESRASRFWHRSERLLDASKEKHHVARELVQKATDEELGTLLEELPVYLKSVGAQTSWLDEEVARRAPEYGAAKQRLRRASQAVVQVNGSATLLRNAMRERRAMRTPIRFNRSIDPDK